jgi:hypothetical protein
VSDLRAEEVTASRQAHTNEDDLQKLKRYNEFLEAIVFMALVLAVLLLAMWRLANDYEHTAIRSILLLASIVTAGVTTLFGFFCRIDSRWEFLWFDRLLARQQREWMLKAKIVVALFFFYLTALTLAVVIYGGAGISPFASLIVLNASFGYYLAKNPRIKQAVVGFSVLGFLVSSVLYIPQNPGKFAGIGRYLHFSYLTVIHWLAVTLVVAVTVYLDWKKGSVDKVG